jgi:hypothetical protein
MAYQGKGISFWLLTSLFSLLYLLSIAKILKSGARHERRPLLYKRQQENQQLL